MKCKWCESNQVTRYGTRGGKQIWKCKSCRRYFTHGEKREIKKILLTYNYSLGYIIGVLSGDGSLSKWRDYHYFDEKGRQTPKAEATKIVPRYRCGFQLSVKDKDFAEEFAKHLQEVTGRKPCFYQVKSKGKTTVNLIPVPYIFHGFKVQLISKEWYHKLKPFKENLSWIKDSSTEVKRGFLRGIFDSEGCVENGRARIILTNKDVNLLKLTCNILEEFEIHSKIYSCPSGKGLSVIHITGLDTKTFHKKIGFSIQRKNRGKKF